MRSILFLLTTTLAFPAASFAQTTFATITGLVTDPNGAVVPGAIITAMNLETNYRYSGKSNETGNYSIGQLLEGRYDVKAEAPGFKTFREKAVRLGNQELRRIDVHLEIGSVETTVEVNGTAALIETENARIGDTKNAETIKDLPLNQRSLWDFVGQNPGVIQAANGAATRRFSGSRNNQSDASVDGITISNGRDGTQITPLVNYVESMAEVRVDMANNSAEFGGLGQVTVVSKSGSNELHGSGFDYYQTPILVSRNPFASSGSAGVTNWPGASIGGPVYFPKIHNGKNKTFFFFSYETNRGSQIHDLINPTVPLASWRNGDFSAMPSTTVKDPLNNNAPFPGNAIPTARINPVAQKIQDLFYPVPNYGNTAVLQSQNFRELLSRPFDPATYWTTRLDHRFSDRGFLFGRFTWARQYSRTWDDNLPTIGRIANERENQAANVSYSHSFTPNLMNEVRWGAAYNDQPRKRRSDRAECGAGTRPHRPRTQPAEHRRHPAGKLERPGTAGHHPAGLAAARLQEQGISVSGQPELVSRPPHHQGGLRPGSHLLCGRQRTHQPVRFRHLLQPLHRLSLCRLSTGHPHNIGSFLPELPGRGGPLVV
jgi:hypothetical protein